MRTLDSGSESTLDQLDRQVGVNCADSRTSCDPQSLRSHRKPKSKDLGGALVRDVLSAMVYCPARGTKIAAYETYLHLCLSLVFNLCHVNRLGSVPLRWGKLTRA